MTRAVYIAPLSTRWVKLKLPLALKDWLCKAGGGSLFVSDSPTASPGDSPEIVPLTRNELVVHATAIPGGALFWTVPDPPPVTAHVCEIGPRALPPVTDSTYAVPLGWGGKEKDVAPFEDVVDRTVDPPSSVAEIVTSSAPARPVMVPPSAYALATQPTVTEVTAPPPTVPEAIAGVDPPKEQVCIWGGNCGCRVTVTV